ncbi:hypothetical protein Tco_0337074 [Tanacetum coccineum]
MFKQLHVNISLADALILIPKYQKILKSLLSNKEKLLELANTPFNENCSAVILKKLLEKLGDPGKFFIPCGFSELKCKALADLGAIINLMPLSVWKKLGYPCYFTHMDPCLANPGNFDPRVPLILGKPFLRTARYLIDVHGEEMILCDGDEKLTLNMRHDTSSYSNQPHKESINMIDFCNVSYEDYLEDFFATNHLSGQIPSISDLLFSSSHLHLFLRKCDTDFDPEGDLHLIEELLNNDPLSPLPLSHNPLSGSTTSSSPNHLLEEFADELALNTFLPGNDDLPFDIESDLREIEYFLNHDPTKEMDSILEDSVDKGNLADPNNDLSDNDDVYDDPFDSKEDKIKESKLFIDELDPLRSSDFLPSPECDSVLYEDFSEVDALPSTNTWTPPPHPKGFNPGILIHEKHFSSHYCRNHRYDCKKISISNDSIILEDFNPPLYELPFHKEVPGSETLLSFSSKNEEKVFNPGILTSKGVHTSLLPELSHRDSKAIQSHLYLLTKPWRFSLLLMERTSCFGCSVSPFLSPMNNSIRGRVKLSDLKQALRGIVPDFEASRARSFVLRSLEL